MGAWIEIVHVTTSNIRPASRTPRWVRGLKFGMATEEDTDGNVAPHDGCVD